MSAADTRRALEADMLATSRALAAAGCRLPVEYALKGAPAYRCRGCSASGLAPDDECCGPLLVEQHWPDMERLADLTRDNNAYALFARLRRANTPYVVSWATPTKAGDGGYFVAAGGLMPCRSQHYAHAAAKAWLSVHQ